MSYQPNIPTGSVPLNLDYQNLRGNFQQLDTVFGVDHTAFSNASAQKGYHEVIHMIPNAGTATPVTGVGELYTQSLNDGIDTDTELFYQTGKGKNIPMTRNFVPSAADNGYTFLPGGLIFQWGKVSSTSSGIVTYASTNIAFPTSCFNVTTQPFYTGAIPNGGATVAIKKNTNLSFNWTFITNSGSYNGFYWSAIGI